MPRNSAPSKIAAVRYYGVEPLFCEPTPESRAATADQVVRATGATLIHPFDNDAVIAGQGTVGLEIIEQIEQVDTIVVPVGGGGLAAGVLIACKSIRPEIEVIAAEPEWADDTARSLSSGRRESAVRYDTIADGLRTPVGEKTFPILQQWLDDLILVSEQAIRDAVESLEHSAHLIVESSGAVAWAAVAKRAGYFANRRTAVVLSGGNRAEVSLSPSP